MKILIAITKSNFGGAQRYVYDIARSLALRHNVAVICGGKGLLVEKLTSAGVRVISIPDLDRDVSVGKDIKVFFNLIKILRNEKPDALMLNSSKIGGVGSVAGRIARIKNIIFVSHGWAWNEERSTMQKLVIRALYGTIGLCSHKIIAVSQAIYNQASFLPILQKKMIVIRHGIDEVPPFSKTKAQELLGVSKKSFIIGSIAELHPIKGFSYAVEALKFISIPDFQYVIIGDGELRDVLKREATDFGVSDKILFKGFIKDAAQYLKAFDVFLLPSLSEAFGYVLAEAGLAEIPVIATSVGGVPEIIKDGETGILVRPRQAKEIANALNALYDGKYDAKKLASNLHIYVKKEFSLDRMISETEKILLN
ncbi:MAG TPA: glycosyltransferase [Candidatus Paceibacterota bacterium]|nr:glycosyltransferase [Candidatus Paceibacterota bacterium]